MKMKSNICWILAALILAFFCRTFLISVYKIPTVSMAPTFWPGDFVLASRISYGFRLPFGTDFYLGSAPARGDLVVFQFDQDKAKEKSTAQYVKRVVAVAGDEIEIKNSRLIINGMPCNYIAKEQKLSVETFGIFEEDCENSKRQIILSNQSDGGPLSVFNRFKVPSGQVFVLGDNRDTSDDSRDLGTVNTDQIASKVLMIWMSYGSTQDFISGSNRVRWNRILTKPR